MTAILLAAASALVWGIGDYSGGRAARRLQALRVVVFSKLCSLPLLVVLLSTMPGRPSAATFAWGLAAGAVGTGALVTFYRALSGGAMAVVAPVSAVTTAMVPLAVGLLAGDRPGPVALVGVLCAVAAIGLVSLAPSTPAPSTPAPSTPAAAHAAAVPLRVAARAAGPAHAARVHAGASGGVARGGDGDADGAVGRHRVAVLSAGERRRVGLRDGLLAGTGFGLFYVLLDLANGTSGGAGLWPVAASQAGALLLGAALLVMAPLPAAPSAVRRSTLPLVMAAGALDLTANAMYAVAVRDGLLSVVAPIAALYPVSTVLLALLLDRERVRPVQVAGLGLAVAALVLVAS